jgi:hypothetical protein
MEQTKPSEEQIISEGDGVTNSTGPTDHDHHNYHHLFFVRHGERADHA